LLSKLELVIKLGVLIGEVVFFLKHPERVTNDIKAGMRNSFFIEFI
jgi:hypothetical protein